MMAVRALVSGRVQGVFFRSTTQDRATSLGLSGWVRNLPDGRVEVFAQGEPESVGRLTDWLRRGPSRAQVEGVQVEDASVDGSLSGFGVRHS